MNDVFKNLMRLQGKRLLTLFLVPLLLTDCVAAIGPSRFSGLSAPSSLTPFTDSFRHAAVLQPMGSSWHPYITGPRIWLTNYLGKVYREAVVVSPALFMVRYGLPILELWLSSSEGLPGFLAASTILVSGLSDDGESGPQVQFEKLDLLYGQSRDLKSQLDQLQANLKSTGLLIEKKLHDPDTSAKFQNLASDVDYAYLAVQRLEDVINQPPPRLTLSDILIEAERQYNSLYLLLHRDIKEILNQHRYVLLELNDSRQDHLANLLSEQIHQIDRILSREWLLVEKRELGHWLAGLFYDGDGSISIQTLSQQGAVLFDEGRMYRMIRALVDYQNKAGAKSVSFTLLPDANPAFFNLIIEARDLVISPNELDSFRAVLQSGEETLTTLDDLVELRRASSWRLVRRALKESGGTLAVSSHDGTLFFHVRWPQKSPLFKEQVDALVETDDASGLSHDFRSRIIALGENLTPAAPISLEDTFPDEPWINPYWRAMEKLAKFIAQWPASIHTIQDLARYSKDLYGEFEEQIRHHQTRENASVSILDTGEQPAIKSGNKIVDLLRRVYWLIARQPVILKNIDLKILFDKEYSQVDRAPIIRVSGDSDLPLWTGDVIKLNRAIINAISNAREAHAKHVNIRVSRGQNPETLLITIENDGDWLSGDDLKKAQEALSGGKGFTTKRDPSGLPHGWGLRTIGRAVRSLGGTVLLEGLEVESTGHTAPLYAPRYQITLPVQAPASSAAGIGVNELVGAVAAISASVLFLTPVVGLLTGVFSILAGTLTPRLRQMSTSPAFPRWIQTAA